MRKIKEVLRLHLAAGLSQRQIARSCSLSRSTVSDYLARAEVAGLDWPQIEASSQTELEARLFPPPAPSNRARPQPDFASIHRELRRPGVTLQLLWQEYKSVHREGYQYSQFCDLYRRWRKKLDVTLRQTHRAGEKMFVDYAGQTVAVIDPATGRSRPASIFVAVLGASNYTYAEASLGQGLDSWIGAHTRALQFWKGAPQVVVCDNARTAVNRVCRYEPELNPTYADWAAHYGLAVLPARPRRPRDKAKVEAAVLVVERWILAALRKRRFFSLAELNEAIAELLERLNERPFRKLPGCRRSLFEQLDRPALQPLPAQPFQLARWKKARVNIDYHVELERHYYSVPYALVGRSVEIRYTEQTVEILHRGQRVASHRRSRVVGGYTTAPEHRPQSHQRYLQWTPSRLIAWGGRIGPSTAQAVRQILASRRFPEHGYRACLGLLRLDKSFGPERLEAACRRALAFEAVSYKSVRSILRAGLDRRPLEPTAPRGAPLQHANIRGASFFDQEDSSC